MKITETIEALAQKQQGIVTPKHLMAALDRPFPEPDWSGLPESVRKIYEEFEAIKQKGDVGLGNVIQFATRILETAYPGHYSNIAAMLSAFSLGYPVILEGPPGTGKTTLAKAVPNVLGLYPVFEANMASTRDTDIAGIPNIKLISEEGAVVRLAYLDEEKKKSTTFWASLASIFDEIDAANQTVIAMLLEFFRRRTFNNPVPHEYPTLFVAGLANTGIENVAAKGRALLDRSFYITFENPMRHGIAEEFERILSGDAVLDPENLPPITHSPLEIYRMTRQFQQNVFERWMSIQKEEKGVRELVDEEGMDLIHEILINTDLSRRSIQRLSHAIVGLSTLYNQTLPKEAVELIAPYVLATTRKEREDVMAIVIGNNVNAQDALEVLRKVNEMSSIFETRVIPKLQEEDLQKLLNETGIIQTKGEVEKHLKRLATCNLGRLARDAYESALKEYQGFAKRILKTQLRQYGITQG